jgi:hypothetical protein
MDGTPPPRYPWVGVYPFFREWFHVEEHISRMFYFGSGTLPPTDLLGRGVPIRLSWRVGVPPPSRHQSMAGTPSRVPKVALPSRFLARVYVGDSLQVITQKGDREGGPPGFHEGVTPTPLSFQWEGGACPALLEGGGTPAFASPVTGRHPLQGTQGGTPLPFSSTGLRRRLSSCHRPKMGSGGGCPLR